MNTKSNHLIIIQPALCDKIIADINHVSLTEEVSPRKIMQF